MCQSVLIARIRVCVCFQGLRSDGNRRGSQRQVGGVHQGTGDCKLDIRFRQGAPGYGQHPDEREDECSGEEVVDQGLARVGDELPPTTRDVRELQEKLDVTDGMLAARSSELTQHIAEFAEVKATLEEVTTLIAGIRGDLDAEVEKLKDFTKTTNLHLDGSAGLVKRT